MCVRVAARCAGACSGPPPGFPKFRIPYTLVHNWKLSCPLIPPPSREISPAGRTVNPRTPLPVVCRARCGGGGLQRGPSGAPRLEQRKPLRLAQPDSSAGGRR